jgi:PAS domain S-box-containing protein
VKNADAVNWPAFVAIALSPEADELPPFIVLACGGALAGLGAYCLLGWVLGVPSLGTWKAGALPVAPVTGILSMLLGSAECLSAPTMRQRASKSAILIGLVFTGLATSIVIFGYSFYRQQEAQFRQHAEDELRSIAALTVGQVDQWRRERIGHATMIRDDAILTSTGRDLLEGRSTAANARKLRDWLQSYSAYGQSDRAWLIDAHGTMVFAEPASAGAVPAGVFDEVSAALARRQIGILDFYLDDNGQHHRLALVIPVLDDAVNGRTVGTLVLRINPDEVLHPLIEHWPGESRTAETLLVSRDGANALFLNDLRFDPNAALHARIPLTNANVLTVKAVLGQTGLTEGIDYRGHQSLGVLSAVPDSPWHLVTKMDLDELHLQMRQARLVVIGFTSVLLFGVAAFLGLVWRQARARHYKELAAWSANLRQSEERLRLALAASAQGLWDLDLQTGAMVVSPEYATVFGDDPAAFQETAASRNARIHPDDRKGVARLFGDYLAGRTGEYRAEFRARTERGEWKWVASIGKLVSRSAGGRPLRMLGTIADITTRKLAEFRIKRLAGLYAALSQCNEAIIRCRTEAELFSRICEAAVTHGGMAMACICLTDEPSEGVIPVAAFGKGVAYLDGIQLSVDASSPFGQGPTGTAIRENRQIWIEDFLHDPTTAAWHARAAAYGWAASGALPLTRDGRVVGTLSLYTLTSDVLDEEGRTLLAEMAVDVSFALESFARRDERAVIEARLLESEQRYRTLFANSSVPMLLIDPADGGIVDANRAASAFYGWAQAILRQMNVTAINALSPEDVQVLAGEILAGRKTRFRLRHRLASGEVRDVEIFATNISLSGQRRFLNTVFDVTAQRRAEQRQNNLELALRTSLHEKEALLKEVHHRVKNNLQVITSLLRLESGRSGHAAVKTAFGEMQNRVLSIALLHETLYRSGNLAQVDLADYLARLGNQVFRSLAPAAGVTFHLDLASAVVEMDQAVPCGLLVNELLSNSLKHAFPGCSGEVWIALQYVAGSQLLRLEVRDNGVGLPADFDRRRESSLGLQLVLDLARQLRGTLDIGGGPGACFSVAFTPTATIETNDRECRS